MVKGVEDDKMESEEQSTALCLHTFSDLSSVSPVVFLFLLKECYVHGKVKATLKFRALPQQVNLALQNAPQPGPAVFTVRCLYALPLFDSFAEGFSHLIISCLRRFLKGYTSNSDLAEAQDLAAHLFLDVIEGFVLHDERILIKILDVLNVKLENFDRVLCGSRLENLGFDNAEAFMENFIFRQIESQSYLTAVSLLEQFGIRHLGESFLYKMIEDNDFRAAKKWASYMGKSMLCVLIEEYVRLNMLKSAYGIIKRNNLQEEYPEVYHKCKESALKTLAEKGCWDVAEGKTKNDRQLLEYLVYLAMEAGYSEKVDELCERYSLEGFSKEKECEVLFQEKRFLQLHEQRIDEIIWVDGADSLQAATSYIEGCKVVGLDCEWKPNYIKGSSPNKVSIMQIGSEKAAFILDLIKLYDDAPKVLNNCLARIFQSPRILKLGYNFQCDMHMLSRSYQKLDCFKSYEMLLDIQKVYKESLGGLSGLAKKILGAGLNKTRRNSNWEQRPLTQQQLEYAALDAVVLVHLFQHVRNYSQPEGSDVKMEWKSHIVSAQTKPNDSLFKAVPGTWSSDQIQALSRHKSAISRTQGRKILKTTTKIEMKWCIRNLVKLVDLKLSITSIETNCTYKYSMVLC